ncbi:MAG TPA: GNAT family N-acetyltransferase [Candidatus Saccharimonadales bacterium]|nr:GNAT family N-acetyltransferase [Candidatus Saccharimonadales bacterium]
MNLHLRVARTLSEVESVSGPWGGLLARTPGAGLFLSPEWYRCWLDAWPGSAEPAVLLLEEPAGALRALLPLARTRERAAGLPVRVTSIGGEALASGDHLGVVAEAGLEGAAWDRVEEWLDGELRRADVVRLGALDDGWQTARVAEAARRRGWRLRERDRQAAPVARLAGSWGEFEAGLGARRRSRLEYYARRLRRELGEVRECLNDEARPLAEVLDLVAGLHTRLWRTRGRAGTLGAAAKRRFLGSFCAEAHRRGWLRLHQLYAGPRLLAAAIVFHFGGVASYYQSGWDPDLRQYNVGELVVLQGLRAAVAEGLARFDFLRGDEPYKRRYAADEVPLVSLDLAARPLGRLLLAAAGGRRRLGAALRGERAARRVRPAEIAE